MAIVKVLLMALLILCLVLSACTKVVAPLSQVTIEELMSNGIVIHPDTDENALLHQLGVPLERREETSNPYHLEYRTNYVTYLYAGLEVLYVQSNSDTNNWKDIIAIVVTSDQYLQQYGLYIGMTQEEILQRFGNPPFDGFESDGILRLNYLNQRSESGYPEITFMLEDDSLTSFRWQAYI